jgi:small subunit ribosomal protein S20
MPNTKSAEKRVRGNVRKAARNQSIKSRLKTLERKYVTALTAGKVDEAKTALLSVASAYAKASKDGVVHKSTAQRKRSRLQLRLNAAAAAPKAAA